MTVRSAPNFRSRFSYRQKWKHRIYRSRSCFRSAKKHCNVCSCGNAN